MDAYSQRFSRRAFVAGTSSFAALHSVANVLPLPPLLAALQSDSRLSQTVIADKGFASVRRVGNGLYATISDPSKGLQTMCNGGFLAGKDSALFVEGFVSPAGAAFQMDAFRSLSQVPVKVRSIRTITSTIPAAIPFMEQTTSPSGLMPRSRAAWWTLTAPCRALKNRPCSPHSRVA